MSNSPTKFGILVAVDGSAVSDAAVAWATREAVLHQVPITLVHVVAPVEVGWPVGRLYEEMPEWQKDNAQQVIEQSRKALTASLGGSPQPEVRTEMLYASVVPTLIEA